MKTCYNCGAENAEAEKFCHQCGANIGDLTHFKDTGIRAGTGVERVLWDNGNIQLTTDAVLMYMGSGEPDVVPLGAIYDVSMDAGCVVLRVNDGEDKTCMIDRPEELAGLIRDQMMRPRLAHQRPDIDFVPPD